MKLGVKRKAGAFIWEESGVRISMNITHSQFTAAMGVRIGNKAVEPSAKSRLSKRDEQRYLERRAAVARFASAEKGKRRMISLRKSER